MYWVTIVNRDHADDGRRQVLAQALRQSPADVQSRLVPHGAPSVVATTLTRDAVEDCRARLDAAGFAVLVLNDADVEHDDRRFMVRSFDLDEESLVVRSYDRRPVHVDVGSIFLLLQGSRFSGDRDDGRHFLHIYSHSHPTLAFSERVGHYRTLGRDLRPTEAENIGFIIGRLRALAPGAAVDDRLLRRRNQGLILGGLANPARDLDVAIALVVRMLDVARQRATPYRRMVGIDPTG